MKGMKRVDILIVAMVLIAMATALSNNIGLMLTMGTAAVAIGVTLIFTSAGYAP